MKIKKTTWNRALFAYIGRGSKYAIKEEKDRKKYRKTIKKNEGK